jgi:outer membrane lipoprotein-sorting protein
MNAYYLSAIIPAMIVAAAPAQATLVEVSAHLRSVNSMTADFAQTDRTGKTLKGQLILKRPGKLRFQYQPGVPLLVVADGNSLYMVDYQVRQVSRWPIGNSPLGILLRPNPELSRIAKLVPSGEANLLLVEARDPKRPEFGTISVALRRQAGAPAGLSLIGWTTVDAQGNRTTVRLSNQRYNHALSDKAFIWRDPRPKGPRS